jgi:PhnB protein
LEENDMAIQPIPAGREHIMPILTVRGAAKFMDFLKEAFGAEETERHASPAGTVMHAELRIGPSVVMTSDANEEFPAVEARLQLYVANVDAVYQRALKAGATSLREPADQFYGDRSAGVKDAFGNQWWLATHVEDVAPDELQRRAARQNG